MLLSNPPGQFLFKCLRVEIVIESDFDKDKMNTWTVFSSLFTFQQSFLALVHLNEQKMICFRFVFDVLYLYFMILMLLLGLMIYLKG